MGRLVGGALLVAAGALPGVVWALGLRRRVDALLDLRQTLQFFRAGIGYGSLPLPELIRTGDTAFCRLAAGEKRFQEDPKAALGRAGERLLEDPADRELYRAFLGGLGTSGAKSQLEHLELYAALTEKNLSAAREVRDRRSRLCVALGVFGGLALCLVFV